MRCVAACRAGWRGRSVLRCCTSSRTPLRAGRQGCCRRRGGGGPVGRGWPGRGLQGWLKPSEETAAVRPGRAAGIEPAGVLLRASHPGRVTTLAAEVTPLHGWDFDQALETVAGFLEAVLTRQAPMQRTATAWTAAAADEPCPLTWLRRPCIREISKLSIAECVVLAVLTAGQQCQRCC